MSEGSTDRLGFKSEFLDVAGNLIEKIDYRKCNTKPERRHQMTTLAFAPIYEQPDTDSGQDDHAYDHEIPLEGLGRPMGFSRHILGFKLAGDISVVSGVNRVDSGRSLQPETEGSQ